MVLHGVIAVAALKLPLHGRHGDDDHGSPRRHCRGRIEARRGAAAASPARMFSPASLPWPHCSRAPEAAPRPSRDVLPGVIAVAALKPVHVSPSSLTRAMFSTASLPWPH